MTARRRTRGKWAVRLALVFVLIALAAPHLWAWSQVRTARTEAGRYHPRQALANLDACRHVVGWGNRATLHLLASRCSRQDEDFDRATKEIQEAQQALGGANEDTALEWALLQAAAGNVREVDEFLQRWIGDHPEQAHWVWEALVQGNLRVYRILDAKAYLDLWLQRDPDNVRALELRGQTYVTGKGVTRGAEDYRRVLELDATRDQTRWRLVSALIDLGSYAEAADHLHHILAATPDDPQAIALLARCYNFVGRRAEARQILDDALARHPDHGLCLRTRGQLALMDDQKPEAEAWLRRAVAVMPHDHQTHWLLFEALRQQGKDDEARAQNAVTERVKEQATRLSDLQSRKLAEFPLDPALHFEMGTLLTQSGRTDVAAQWFLSTLALDPTHHGAHAALAAHYDRIGDPARAEQHRRLAGHP